MNNAAILVSYLNRYNIYFTDVCFKPPYGDNGHPEQEKGLKAGIGICDQRIKDEC